MKKPNPENKKTTTKERSKEGGEKKERGSRKKKVAGNEERGWKTNRTRRGEKRESGGEGRRGKERDPAGCTADIARLPAGQIGNKNISILNKKLR